MISFPILKRNLLSIIKLSIIFLAILAMYNSVIIYMFDPALADMLNDFQKAMPEIMSAVGMIGGTGTLTEFVNTYLYGFIMQMIPMIFTIVMVNRLVMRYVDNGSMACLLASPNSRRKVITTQLLSIIIGITFLVAAISLIGYFCCESMFPGELELDKYLQLNVSVWLLHLAIAAIIFFAACFFNETKFFYAIGAGLPLLFYMIQMMANMGGDLKNMKYATIFTLFPGQQIVAGDPGVLSSNLILAGIAALLFGAGSIYFSKKDLPL